MLTGYAWSTGLEMGLLGMLNLALASSFAALNMAQRFTLTQDTGWLRLSIPFVMMFVFAVCGYAHYLLTIVAQLASALTLYLTLRDAKS